MGPTQRLPEGYPRLGQWAWKGVSVSDEAHDTLQRGLRWLYAYNHEEAICCFEEVLRADPQCCMAAWGVAYALGPNYNLPWFFISDDTVKLARKHALDALTLAEGYGFALEKALCRTLMLRYPRNGKVSQPEEMQEWSEAYAQGMIDLADSSLGEYSVDVLVLAAEAIMCVTPWQLWDLRTGKSMPPPARPAEALRLLEKALRSVKERQLPDHTGALHLYIHLMEMSHTPERALPAYDRLASGICPDAGHLLHMGTHIGILCGEYQQAVVQNREAAQADLRFYVYKKHAKSFYVLYLLHNYHFMCYGAMFAGDSASALEAADAIRGIATDSLMKWNRMACFADTYRAVKYHVLVRFGKWQMILDEVFPEDLTLHCFQVAVLHYARALAFAIGKNDHAKARAETVLFEEAYAAVPEGRARTLHNNTGRDLLDVSREMMYGEVAFRRGDHSEGLARVAKAVDMEEALPYDEPWGVMQPTRHALGALLLEAGRAEDALRVFNEDLGRGEEGRRVPRPNIHVDNIWAMLGVIDASEVLGRKVDPAFARRLQIQLRRADPSIKASCFCRVSKCGHLCSSL